MVWKHRLHMVRTPLDGLMNTHIMIYLSSTMNKWKQMVIL